ncbi:MAG: response regulator [Planctomycetota bacterium]
MDTILLVNDSPTLTKVLSSHFQRAGYKVLAVTGAMDAYEAFIRNEVQLILTDYVLKDKDGMQVIETFRHTKNHKALPIVVFTALDDEATAKRCKDAGANLVLAKSGGTSSILENIEKLIAEYRASMPSRSLDADLGHCIVKATSEVFRTMMNLPVQAGEVSIEKARTRKSEVIGSLGVAGFLSGSISVFLPRTLAQTVAVTMLMLEPDTEMANEELVDAIGELTNMIGGNIKTELFQKTPLFDISIPSVYIGEDLQRRTVAEDLCFYVPFRVGDQEFAVEFLMITKEKGGTGVQQSMLATG